MCYCHDQFPFGPTCLVKAKDLKLQKQRADKTARNALQKQIEAYKRENFGEKQKGRKATAKPKAAAALLATCGFDLPEDPELRAEVIKQAIQDSEKVEEMIGQIVNACSLPQKLSITRLDQSGRGSRAKQMKELLRQAEEAVKSGGSGAGGGNQPEHGNWLDFFGLKGTLKHTEESGHVLTNELDGFVLNTYRIIYSTLANIYLYI